MASVSYYLRSKVQDKDCTVWLRFRDKGIDLKVPVPYLRCKPKDWKDGKCKIPSKKMSAEDLDTLNVRLLKLEGDILSKFSAEKPDDYIKEWLENVIDPVKALKIEEAYSDEIIVFIDDYIALKRAQNTSESTVKKANVVKNLLIRYIESRRHNRKTFKTLKFKDLDNSFRVDFEKYCNDEHYKISTTYRNLKFVKMVCKVAESFDIEINRHVWGWKFEIEKATKDLPKSIYLTQADLLKIEQTEMPHEYLENAKDWLIIACNCAQRVSDYLRFTSNMIVVDDGGQKYIDFTQQKTKAKMKIPLLKKVQEILDKRDGEFPRRISDVKLNLYIKEVCEIAEINEMIYNGVVKTSVKDGKNITRKVFSEYPKWQLVTSHIGRKSFASNFYEIIPTTYLLNFTGHKTEKQLLNYINKSEVEKAKSTAKFFSNLGY
ncbi:MAG: hypothetical protein K0R77_2150 [Chryseobacterium sp.]|jgi:integrase|uniref:phage integrase SAM-like domain-containing protein n=1 Tax=Chryseobacterium sp. TaxID=1871047 RepID=UPI00263805A3|nr:phage integrase SAM-like domain-containing protein [Chryseobacterium sp.]MDF2552875.1 hypothetical protein [Chryseobacterium sp.]